MPLDLLHTDQHLWVINKPSGLSLLRDRTGDPNLWDIIKAELGKPYLVHRLDKGTSGVLIVARTQNVQSELTRAFAKHQVKKHYLAWVVGHFPKGSTYEIDMPLCKGRKSRYRIAGERSNITLQENRFTVTQDRAGFEAFTKVRCLRHTDHHSLLLLAPKHGRTHQLRVHLGWLGYAIVGDHLYGSKADPLQVHPRLHLHCTRLGMPSHLGSLQTTRFKSGFDLLASDDLPRI